MALQNDGLRELAAKCVSLVAADFGRTLDWQIDSLEVLDAVCKQLLAEGALTGERLDLWWKVIGAYVGEVVVRTYRGQWITHAMAPGAYAVNINDMIGFPFATTQRVLDGEPLKSLASFGRVVAHGPAPRTK